MARKLDKSTEIPGTRMVDAYNELCQSHNDLCLAHDELALRYQAMEEKIEEMYALIDNLMDAVYEPASGYDS